MRAKAEEAAWRASTQPMRYRMESACTGNCNQGRSCDCVPNVPEPVPLTTSDFRLAFVIVACLAVPLALGPMFSLGPMVFNWVYGVFGGAA